MAEECEVTDACRCLLLNTHLAGSTLIASIFALYDQFFRKLNDLGFLQPG